MSFLPDGVYELQHLFNIQIKVLDMHYGPVMTISKQSRILPRSQYHILGI